jgi:hypothetical protein
MKYLVFLTGVEMENIKEKPEAVLKGYRSALDPQ